MCLWKVCAVLQQNWSSCDKQQPCLNRINASVKNSRFHEVKLELSSHGFADFQKVVFARRQRISMTISIWRVPRNMTNWQFMIFLQHTFTEMCAIVLDVRTCSRSGFHQKQQITIQERCALNPPPCFWFWWWQTSGGTQKSTKYKFQHSFGHFWCLFLFVSACCFIETCK